MSPALAGKRILVVEDEALIAMMVEDLLADAGCVVIGPFGRVADAVAAARIEAVDAALLDVNVAGEKVFPVAHVLEARHIPFLFVTGYGQAAMPADHPDWRACTKPFTMEQLTDQLEQVFQRAAM